MKRIKELIKRYKDWKESPDIKRNRMIIFFSFYLIFFIFFFAFLRNVMKDNNNTEIIEEDVLYKTKLIENNNYEYNYVIEENGNIITFMGYRDNDNYELSEYKYKELVNIYTVKKIIKNSKYLLKLEEGNIVKYKYEITNINLAKILNNNSDIENNINTIFIYVDEDKNVYRIDCDYSNYMQSINEYDSYLLTIKYGVLKNEESSTN